MPGGLRRSLLHGPPGAGPTSVVRLFCILIATTAPHNWAQDIAPGGVERPLTSEPGDLSVDGGMAHAARRPLELTSDRLASLGTLSGQHTVSQALTVHHLLGSHHGRHLEGHKDGAEEDEGAREEEGGGDEADKAQHRTKRSVKVARRGTPPLPPLPVTLGPPLSSLAGPLTAARCALVLGTGRGGSGALAVALNGLPGYLLRGEQQGAAWELFLADRMMYRSYAFPNKTKDGLDPDALTRQYGPDAMARLGLPTVRAAYERLAYKYKLPWFSDVHPARLRAGMRALYGAVYGGGGQGTVSGFVDSRLTLGRMLPYTEATTYELFVDMLQFLTGLCEDTRLLLVSRAGSLAADLEGPEAHAPSRPQPQPRVVEMLGTTRVWYDRYAKEHPDTAMRIDTEHMFDPEKNATLARRLLRFLGEDPKAHSLAFRPLTATGGGGHSVAHHGAPHAGGTQAGGTQAGKPRRAAEAQPGEAGPTTDRPASGGAPNGGLHSVTRQRRLRAASAGPSSPQGTGPRAGVGGGAAGADPPAYGGKAPAGAARSAAGGGGGAPAAARQAAAEGLPGGSMTQGHTQRPARPASGATAARPAPGPAARAAGNAPAAAPVPLFSARCVFVLGTGRSGSSSLMDAVNQLPGRCVRGEQWAAFAYLHEAARRIHAASQDAREALWAAQHRAAATGKDGGALLGGAHGHGHGGGAAPSAAAASLEKSAAGFGRDGERLAAGLRAYYALTYGYHGEGAVSGFKDLRYVAGRAFPSGTSTYEHFASFLAFLRGLCGQAKILLNSRASASSEENTKLISMTKNFNTKTTEADDLNTTHAWFDRYAAEHPTVAMRVVMEDMFGPKNATLSRRLVSFLGEDPDAHALAFDRMPTWSLVKNSFWHRHAGFDREPWQLRRRER